MKRWMIFAMFWGIGMSVVYADDARAILEQAITKTQNTRFETTISSPYAEVDDDISMYYGDTWKIYRSVNNDDVKERVDILTGDQLQASYVANEDGVFGWRLDGFCAAMLYCQALGYAGFVWGIPDQEVWNEATFESKPRLYRKIPCTQVLVTVTNPRKPFGKRGIETDEKFQKRRDKYIAYSPHTYEYMIGTEDHFIYRKRVFNSRGVVVQEFELGDVVIADQPEELFDVTEEVQGRFLDDISFYARNLRDMFAVTTRHRGIPWYQKGLNYFARNATVFSLILGASALLIAFGIKIYRKYRAN